MKVSELSGRKLDEWVARVVGHHVTTYQSENGRPVLTATFGGRTLIIEGGTTMEWLKSGLYHPSTDWKFGGPLIESRRVAVQPSPSGWDALVGKVFDDWDGLPIAPYGYGPTPLVAAMRAIVVSVCGDEVQS